MAFRIERIDHVVLRVSDLEAMVAFYRDALGCAVERRIDRLGLVQMRAGASLLDLVAREPGAARAAARNMDHLCFRVEPFDAAAISARLSRFGIAVGEPARRYGAEGEGPSVYFDDPEGNTVELKGPADPLPA